MIDGQDPGRPSSLADVLRGGPEQDSQSLGRQLGQIAAETAATRAQEARGPLEHVQWTGLAAAKELGDGFQSVANLLYKTGAGVGSMVGGGGFGQGWDQASKQFKQTYGDSDPSILDLVGNQQDGMSAGERADRLIDARLGKWALLGRTIGSVASFMLPGAPVGRAAGNATKIAGEIGERVLAKAALKRAGVDDLVAKSLIESGNVWGYLAQNPAIGQNIRAMDHALRATGRNFRDLMEVGAANIAQSYAIAPDDQRTHGAIVAAMTTPFVLPVARLGQKLGQVVMQRGLGQEQAAVVAQSFSRFQAGEMNVRELRAAIADQVGIGSRAASGLVTSAFEGTAFMGMDPSVVRMLPAALSGDQEAIAQLTAIWLGSVTGIAATKMGIAGVDQAAGQDTREIPFFRQSAPDLNRLSIYLEAHANKVAAKRDSELRAKLDSGADIDVRDVGEIAVREARAAQQEPGRAATERALTEEPARDKADIAEVVNRETAYEQARDRLLPETHAEVKARYGWADGPSLPLLRAAWTAEPLEQGSAVMLRYGRDHSVQLLQDGNLVLSPEVEGVLRDFGVAPDESSPNRTIDAPTRIRLTGVLAKKAADDVALIGALRRVQGDNRFDRLGYSEIEPGIWTDRDGILYQAQLDGTTVSRELDGPWNQITNLRVVGREGGPAWDGPAAQALTKWVAQKQAIAPDPLVDSLILEAVEAARYGSSRGAGALRELLAATDGADLVANLGVGTDREVAFLLASLAAGNGNARSVAAEIAAVAQHKGKPPSPEGRADYLRAMEGEPPQPTPEQQQQADRAAYMEAMEEAAAATDRPDDPSYQPPVPKRQQRRNDLADLAKAVGDQRLSEPTMVSAQQAATLRRLVPAKSSLGRQLQQVEQSGGVGEVRATGTEFAKLTREWAKWGEKVDPNAPEVEVVTALRAAQSVDSLLENIGRSLGVDIDRRTLPDMLSGEAVVGSVGAELRPVGQAMGRKVGAMADYLVRPEPEVLLRHMPDEPLGYEVRAVQSEAPALRGRALEAARTAEQARHGKLGATAAERRQNKAQTKALLRERLPVEGYGTDAEGRPKGTIPATLALMDAARRPTTDVERAFAAAGQGTQKVLWEAGREAGMLRATRTQEGKVVELPMEARTKFVQPREMGKDHDEVMADPALRKAWFEDLVAANPDVKTFAADESGKRVERRITVEDLEAEHMQLVTSRGDGLESEAAMEFRRRFKNVAYEWRGPDGKVREMYETNPFEALQRSARSQSARVAATKQWGQQVSQETRAALKAMNEVAPLAPEVLANLERGGVTKRLARFSEAVAKTSMTPDARHQVLKAAEDVLQRSQGAEPIERTAFTRAVSPWLSFRSAAQTTTSFVLDIPDLLFRLPAFAGMRDTARAIWAFRPRWAGGEGPEAMIRTAESLGAIEREMGDYVFDEARGLSAKAATFVGKPGNWTERAKGAIATRAANQIIEQMRAGKAAPKFYELAEGMLQMSPAQIQALHRGQISPALESQFRREFVAEFTSRVRPGEGSRFAADPNKAQIWTFSKWLTRRTASHLRAINAVVKAQQQYGWTDARTRRAFIRAMGIASGMAIGGSVGTALYTILNGVVAGDPIEEGFQKVYNEVRDGQWAYLGRGMRSAAISGPAETLRRAASDPNSAQAWANIMAPTSIGYALVRSMVMANRGDYAGAMDAMARTGFVPFRSQVQTLANVTLPAILGKDTQHILDAKLAREWQRLNDIERPFGDRNKPDEFYEAVGDALDAVRSNLGNPAKAMADAMEGIREALALAPEDSVAGSIEGHQLLHHLTNDQRTKLIAFVNDDARMNRMFQHDYLLRLLAKEARKLEGANPTEWAAELASVQEQARLGGGDRWRALTDRVLDESAARIVAGDGAGTQIDDLAEAMAGYSAQVAELFDKKAMRYLLSDQPDHLQKARRIAAALRSRARDRAADLRKAAAR